MTKPTVPHKRTIPDARLGRDLFTVVVVVVVAIFFEKDLPMEEPVCIPTRLVPKFEDKLETPDNCSYKKVMKTKVTNDELKRENSCVNGTVWCFTNFGTICVV